MPLTSGEKLGQYEILALIGKRGMGEVYRANDTKLGREVAIKVLPEALARDPDRLARFEREAKVLASLNHPNIATIYGMEGAALVMELVEGETLAVPEHLDSALKQARQIAEALEYAHERGVIHRDLKPANIKVTPEGSVKLLDFGLAKAIEDPAEPPDPSNSPTLTLGHTRAGVILGTAAYMSPEQAHGKPTDRRSDIFSFGAVLYEMFTGKQAFTGESMGDTLASVLKFDPGWMALPPETPPAIVRLLHRCLAKDRKQRLQAIGEARIVLESPFVEDATTPKPSRDRQGAVYTLAALALVAAAVALWGWLRPRPPDTHAVMRFQDAVSVTASPDGIALSRDGSHLAFVSGPMHQIYVRMLDQFEARPLPGTENAAFLCFSPDGQSISFMSVDRPGTEALKKISIAGGPAQKLATAETAPGPPMQSWEEDGNIYFASAGILQRISQNGGQPQTLAAPDNKKGERYFAGPQLLPAGTHLLVSIYVGGSVNGHQVVALSLRTGARKILLDHAGISQYLAAGPGSEMGYLLYWDAVSGSLMAVPFDAKRLDVKGSPVAVMDGIGSAVGPFGQFGISDSGTLAYAPGNPTQGQGPGRTLVWIDRQGTEEPISAPPRAYDRPSLSPNGDRVAVGIQYARGGGPGDVNLWVYDLMRGGGLLPIVSENSDISPAWTPDGKRLIYASAVGNGALVWASIPADNSGPPTVLASQLAVGVIPDSVSPDGKIVIGGSLATRIWQLPLASGSKPEIFIDTPGRKRYARFSPDGHWVAYTSDESGQEEVYVQAYPGPGGRAIVSTEGGTNPRWSRNMKELFYVSGARMMAVDDIQLTPVPRFGKPRMLFEGSANYGYDVSPDGKFLMIKNAAAPQASQPGQLKVVVNWLDELRRRLPIPK